MNYEFGNCFAKTVCPFERTVSQSHRILSTTLRRARRVVAFPFAKKKEDFTFMDGLRRLRRHFFPSRPSFCKDTRTEPAATDRPTGVSLLLWAVWQTATAKSGYTAKITIKVTLSTHSLRRLAQHCLYGNVALMPACLVPAEGKGCCGTGASS